MFCLIETVISLRRVLGILPVFVIFKQYDQIQIPLNSMEQFGQWHFYFIIGSGEALTVTYLMPASYSVVLIVYRIGVQ